MGTDRSADQYNEAPSTIIVAADQIDPSLISHRPDSMKIESRYAQSRSILTTLSQKETRERTFIQLRALLPDRASFGINPVLNYLEQQHFITKLNKEGAGATYALTKEGWDKLLRINCTLVLEALGEQTLLLQEISDALKPNTIPDLGLFILTLTKANFVIDDRKRPETGNIIGW